MTMLRILEYAESAAEKAWHRALSDIEFAQEREEDGCGFSPDTVALLEEHERETYHDFMEIRRMIEEEDAKITEFSEK